MSLWAECDIYEFYTNENYAQVYMDAAADIHRYILYVYIHT